MIDWLSLAQCAGYRNEKALLKEWYTEGKLSLREIAKRLGVGQITVLYKLRECGIPLRHKGRSAHYCVIPWQELLNEKPKRVVELYDISLSTVYRWRTALRLLLLKRKKRS